MNSYRIKLISIVLALLPALLHGGQSELSIKDAWVQEGPPNARVLAGFMLITNNGKSPANITAAKSDVFESIEFHRTVHTDGMARMVKQEQLTIQPGSTLKLEHGGYHLMLMQPRKRLTKDDSVTIELTLASGMSMKIKLPVRQPQEDQMQHHHHHH